VGQLISGLSKSHRTPRIEASDSETKLRGIVSLAADAIVSTDESFRITLFNPAAERIAMRLGLLTED
jgi:PAS domain-containing protein